MPAKDIIDLIIENPAGQMPTIIAVLDKVGYIHEGNKGIPTREAFRPKPASVAARLPPHHLYACETGFSELFRHLAFRDYLIAHPARARWLGEQKLARDRSAACRSEYIEHKADAYAIITNESLFWAGNAK